MNNSIVNVNLNSLKDVNLDEMIDDDDDEERKFLIRELEKKAAAGGKKGGSGGGLNTSTGYNSDTGSTGGGVRVKRSRSNSSTAGGRDAYDSPLDQSLVSSAVVTTSTPPAPTQHQQQHHPPTLTAQLNITLNCHYCWAQFQLNVTKNLKNSVQQKENGKYMQHLALHLNAPYKCNECSYPITDTKTFFKHKQFYKHDEKTCIMVDNDLSLPNNTNSSSQAGLVRRKTLISTRLRQFLANLHVEKNHHHHHHSKEESSNEIELEHENDSFKCTLCYPDTEPAPSSSTSSLNKKPTPSTLGASNFSFDKEQVLKHVLIVHLSFLAYKCDTCVQFYAFDEPQTKQHAALVHQNNEVACQFKLIKTEEEINLAINRAQQFIAKIGATSAASRKLAAESSLSEAAAANTKRQQAQSTNTPIDAVPKYKCCKCSPTAATAISTTANTATTDGTTESTSTPTQPHPQQPIVLYTYQEALDHVMSMHMSPQLRQQQQQMKSSGGQQKQALNYELELFEQQMEDLISSETGVVTTIAANKAAAAAAAGVENQDENCSEDSDDEDLGEWAAGASEFEQENVDFSEWSIALSEPAHLVQSTSVSSGPSGSGENTTSPSQLGHRRKRFKTNANTSISDLSATSVGQTALLTRPGQHHHPKRFFYKPYLHIKCLICSRRMNELDVDHWLQHEAESHRRLLGGGTSLKEQESSGSKFVYQQLRNASQTETTTTTTGEVTTTTTTTTGQSSSHVSSKSYDSFGQFWQDFCANEKNAKTFAE